MCEHRQSRNGKGYIMRKKMYARALAIVLAISMVGCGSNNTNIPSLGLNRDFFYFGSNNNRRSNRKRS